MVGKVLLLGDEDTIVLSHTSAVVKDTPVYLNGIGVALPQTSSDANLPVAYKLEGLVCATVAESIAVAVGNNVFYDSAAGKVVLLKPTAGFYLGVAVTAGTGNADGTVGVDVLINKVSDGFGNYQSVNIYGGTLLEQRSVVAGADSAVTLTAANIKSGIITQTPSAARAITLPAAADLLALFPNAVVGSSFEIIVINLAANTHVITMTASGTFTIVGLATVQPATSATFRVVFTNVSTAAVVAYRA